MGVFREWSVEYVFIVWVVKIKESGNWDDGVENFKVELEFINKIIGDFFKFFLFIYEKMND